MCFSWQSPHISPKAYPASSVTVSTPPPASPPRTAWSTCTPAQATGTTHCVGRLTKLWGGTGLSWESVAGGWVFSPVPNINTTFSSFLGYRFSLLQDSVRWVQHQDLSLRRARMQQGWQGAWGHWTMACACVFTFHIGYDLVTGKMYSLLCQTSLNCFLVRIIEFKHIFEYHQYLIRISP